jgi:predicted  nucleic acid-binding Zn-ribbon protein
MSELTGEEIVKRIVSDKGALKDLIYHIVSDPEMRMAVISAVLSEVATKQDVRDLRQEMNQLRQEMNQLRQEMNQLRQEMNQLRQEMNQLRREVDARFDGLRREMDARFNEVRREINDLRREMRSLIRWTITAILIVWGSTVLPVMMRLAGII